MFTLCVFLFVLSSFLFIKGIHLYLRVRAGESVFMVFVCLFVCLFVCSSLFCLLFSVEITKIKTNTNIEASCIILPTIERLSSVAQLRNTE